MKNLFTTKAERLAAFKNIDLYPVISSEFTHDRPVLYILEEIAAAGAKIVQLREKNKSKKAIYELAVEYRKITSAHRILLIINDYLDIALAVGADGVHLGQDDLPLTVARKLTDALLLGSSTHNLPEALAAQTEGADYINIGPVFPTGTKAVPCGAIGIEAVKNISRQVNIPFTVMGGIKAGHLPELLAIGATHIAMVTEITQAENVKAQTARLRKFWK
ncbi:MAG: thiamine phosphate synthase [Victivallaceae bacterium]